MVQSSVPWISGPIHQMYNSKSFHRVLSSGSRIDGFQCYPERFYDLETLCHSGWDNTSRWTFAYKGIEMWHRLWHIATVLVEPYSKIYILGPLHTLKLAVYLTAIEDSYSFVYLILCVANILTYIRKPWQRSTVTVLRSMVMAGGHVSCYRLSCSVFESFLAVWITVRQIALRHREFWVVLSRGPQLLPAHRIAGFIFSRKFNNHQFHQIYSAEQAVARWYDWLSWDELSWAMATLILKAFLFLLIAQKIWRRYFAC